jgi:hypothetical protein
MNIALMDPVRLYRLHLIKVANWEDENRIYGLEGAFLLATVACAVNRPTSVAMRNLRYNAMNCGQRALMNEGGTNLASPPTPRSDPLLHSGVAPLPLNFRWTAESFRNG